MLSYTIARHEWRTVVLFALILVVLTTLPYALAWTQQGTDWQFSGFLFGVEDGYSYLGKMRLGVRGLWDFYLFYTPEVHDPIPLIFLPYIIPGQIIGLFMADTDPALPTVMAVVFHALRAVFNVLLVVVTYRFIAAFIRPPRDRFVALVLATLGGGLGWLLALTGLDRTIGTLLPDFFIPEGFTFLILYGLPHVALARAALLGGLLLIINTFPPPAPLPIAMGRGWGWGRIILAGSCWLIVGLNVPFYLVILYCILGAWGLTAWIRARRFPLELALRCIVAGGITLPLFAHYLIAFSRNPAFAQWSAQNLLPSPNIIQYTLAYILIAIPAALGIRRAWRRARSHMGYALLVGWTLVVPLLVYLPINVQRRMSESVLVPLAILAVMGVRLWLRTRQRRVHPLWRRVRTAWVVALTLTSAFLLLGGVVQALAPSRPIPVFRPAAEVTALTWLNQHAQPDEVILAAVLTGNVVPGYTHLRPFMGHGPETLDWQQKTAQLERFFGGAMTASERTDLFNRFKIRYVFYGPLERRLAGNSNEPPAWTEGLTLLYDSGGYQIFQVVSNK